MPPPLLHRAATAEDADADAGAEEEDQQREEEEALAATVVSGFLLTDEEVDRLTTAITTARVAACTAAYTTGVGAVGGKLPPDWTLPPTLLHAQERAAQDHATGMADTWQQDLTATAVAFLLTWRHDHPDAATAAASAPLVAHLGTWAPAHGADKAAAVGPYETGDGAEDGTDTLMDDLMSDDVEDDLGDGPVDWSNVLVAVQPDESSPDECEDYAGNVYSLDEALALPSFPMHVFCIHYKEIYENAASDG